MGRVPSKKTGSAARDPKELWLTHPWLEEARPGLFMLLALPEIEGEPREPASIRLFVQDGKLKAAINDPSSESVWFATLEGSTDPLHALERHFSEDRGEWREQKSQGKSRKPF